MPADPSATTAKFVPSGSGVAPSGNGVPGNGLPAVRVASPRSLGGPVGVGVGPTQGLVTARLWRLPLCIRRGGVVTGWGRMIGVRQPHETAGRARRCAGSRDTSLVAGARA